MRLFGYRATRQFNAGVPSDAFVTFQLLPLNTVTGPGVMVARQLQIDTQQMVQAMGAPEAWNGIITGQFVTQPLVDQGGMS